MEKETIYRHVFEAFSALSDAQDTLRPTSTTAQELISHAKLHLMAVLNDDPESFRAVVVGKPVGCSLVDDLAGEPGHEPGCQCARASCTLARLQPIYDEEISEALRNVGL